MSTWTASPGRRLTLFFGTSLAVVALPFVPAVVIANEVIANPDPSVIGADIGGGLVATLITVAGMFVGALAAGLISPDWAPPVLSVVVMGLGHPFPLLFFTDNYDSGVYVLVIPLLVTGILGAAIGIGLRRLGLMICRRVTAPAA